MAYYADLQRNITDSTAPTISNKLDSIRAYQWEITFASPHATQAVGGGAGKPLTLAAKQVNGLGFSVEDIEVHRVNDRVFYPGKATPEELTVTFDNLYQKKVSTTLWNWFKSIYNPLTGELLENVTTALGALSPENLRFINQILMVNL